MTMTDKLAKPLRVLWGEDVLDLARRHRESGMELDRSGRERILALYLKKIRLLVNSREDVGALLRESMAHADPASSAKGPVTEILTAANVPASGTEDIFAKAVDVILEELEEQRKSGAKRWIVDERTGRAIAPLTLETIYQPPDYVGEDGKLHKAAPKLHPSIAVGLAETWIKAERDDKIAALAADPIRGRAYRHLTDPQRIADLARIRLREAGVKVLDPDSSLSDGSETVVEFGRENVEADLQSVNESFHRTANYAAVLATKVVKLCPPGATCTIGKVETKTGPKERWFTVPIQVVHQS